MHDCAGALDGRRSAKTRLLSSIPRGSVEAASRGGISGTPRHRALFAVTRRPRGRTTRPPSRSGKFQHEACSVLKAPAVAQRARKATPPGVLDRPGLSSTLEVGTGQHSSAKYSITGHVRRIDSRPILLARRSTAQGRRTPGFRRARWIESIEYKVRPQVTKATCRPKCTSCAIICCHFCPRLMSGVGPWQNIQEVVIMSRVEELQTAIAALAPEEYARLRQWFAERDWEQWDRQIEEDAQSGKLDFLIEEAMAEKAQGRLREL